MRTSRTSIALAASLVMILVLACSFVKVNLPGSATETPVAAPTAEPEKATEAEPTATAEVAAQQAATDTAEPEATIAPIDKPADEPTATSGVAATKTPRPKATAKAEPTGKSQGESEELVIKLITETQEVDTLKSVLTMNAQGEDFDGNAVDGDLNLELIANEKLGEYAFTMQGGLVPLVGGGDLDGVSKVGVYQVDDTTYMLTEGDTDNTCTRRPSEPDEFEGMTPESMLSTLTDDEKLYGTLAGEETVNGIQVRHYVVDAQKSIDEASAGSMIETLSKADIYLAAEGGYVVRFTAQYDGEMDLWDSGLDGNLKTQFDLVELNSGTRVVLPEQCLNAVEETPEPEDTPEPENTPEGKSEPLDISPLTQTVKVDSMQSVMTLYLDGKDSAGKALKTDVTIELTQNKTRKQQSMVMNGDGLNILAKMPGLTDLSEIGIYSIGSTVYIDMQTGKTDKCVKSAAAGSMASFDQLSPENLLGSFASRLDTYGYFDGEETVNDVDVRHYVIDADATNAAALKSKDPDVRENAKTQKLVSGDVYIAVDGGYIVRLDAEYEGTAKSLGFKGNTTVEFDLAELNTGVQVELPKACSNATTQ
jgi:hypothetical protein